MSVVKYSSVAIEYLKVHEIGQSIVLYLLLEVGNTNYSLIYFVFKNYAFFRLPYIYVISYY